MQDKSTKSATKLASSTQIFWDLTNGFRMRYVAAIAAMGVGSVFLLLVPYVLKRALDDIASGKATLTGTLLPATGAIIGFNAIHGFFTYLRGRWAAEASEGIVRGLRHQLYSHLEHLPCAYHDKADTGDLVQRCSSDVETVRVFLSAQIVEIARVSLFLLVAIPIMVSQDLRMSLVSLAFVPIIVAFAVLFFRKVRKLFEIVDESEGQLTTVLQENLTGIRVVRAFARQEFEIDKFRKRNDTFRDNEFRLFMALSNYWAASDLLVFAQMGSVLIGGAYFVVAGDISLGTWILFYWLLRTIIWPVRHIGRVLADTGKATVAIGRIREILSEQEESVEALPNEPISGDIVVRNLSFAYGDRQLALDDLSLTIRQGQTVAILGPPGSGKSTLIQLLARLYDYHDGSIQIGGRELNTLNRDEVRSAFGMVLQDPFLYSKTVRENIVIGDESVTDEDVEQAARSADVHNNIHSFSDGYHTDVGERGVTLSGGQRQRLAIARALLMQPSFLVLDDSLSAVDTKTETEILKSLAQRRGKQTTILISHRLSSTRLADRIFVFDHGRLIQSGSHDELINEEGSYRRLWNIQGMLEDEIDKNLRTPHSANGKLSRSLAGEAPP